MSSEPVRLQPEDSPDLVVTPASWPRVWTSARRPCPTSPGPDVRDPRRACRLPARLPRGRGCSTPARATAAPACPACRRRILDRAHRLQLEHGSAYDQPFGCDLFRKRGGATTGSSTPPPAGAPTTCSPARAAATPCSRRTTPCNSSGTAPRRLRRHLARPLDLLQLGALCGRRQRHARPRPRGRRLGAHARGHRRPASSSPRRPRRPQDRGPRHHLPRQPDRPHHPGGAAARAGPRRLRRRHPLRPLRLDLPLGHRRRSRTTSTASCWRSSPRSATAASSSTASPSRWAPRNVRNATCSPARRSSSSCRTAPRTASSRRFTARRWRWRRIGWGSRRPAPPSSSRPRAAGR